MSGVFGWVVADKNICAPTAKTLRLPWATNESKLTYVRYDNLALPFFALNMAIE
jgi:hypothetical protein